MIRLHVRSPLAAQARVALTADQAHYLTRVMRLTAGDQVNLFNGADGEWRATLAPAGRKTWELAVEAQARLQTASPDVELMIALVKRARLETIVEKASELGVRRIRLVITERTNADHANLDRLAAIAIEAAEQCERLEAPPVMAPQPLGALLEGLGAGRRLMFCDEAGDAAPACEALAAEARAGGAAGPWGVIIGPEGGFSPAERAAIRQTPGTVPVSLGPRILRADTAAIAALALWQSCVGDWRGA